MIKNFTVQEGTVVPSLQSRQIVIKEPDRDFTNMLFLAYSEMPIDYQFILSAGAEVIKEGAPTPHNTLPFLLQWKGTFKKSNLNLDIKNLDSNSDLKLNYLVSFFD